VDSDTMRVTGSYWTVGWTPPDSTNDCRTTVAG
jgi:hypothetical protein